MASTLMQGILTCVIATMLVGCDTSDLSHFRKFVDNSRQRLFISTLDEKEDLDLEMTTYLNKNIPLNSALRTSQVVLSCGKFMPFAFFNESDFTKGQYFLQKGVFLNPREAFKQYGNGEEFDASISYADQTQKWKTPSHYWLGVVSGVFNRSDEAQRAQVFELPLECDSANAADLAIVSESWDKDTAERFFEDLGNLTMQDAIAGKAMPAILQSKDDAEIPIYLGYANYPQRPEVYWRIANTAAALVSWRYNPFNDVEKKAQLKQLASILSRLELSASTPENSESSKPLATSPKPDPVEASAPLQEASKPATVVPVPKKEIDVSTVISSS